MLVLGGRRLNAHNLAHKARQPYPSFPLTAHPNGQWCKKIRGRVHFFGIWSDPDASLANYLRVAADLHAGREPASVPTTQLTVKEMGNAFLAYQLERYTTGQISARWFEDCRRVVKHFAKSVGIARSPSSLAAADFQRYRGTLVASGLSGDRGLGVHALYRTITVIRCMFKWAVDTGALEHPPRWGKTLLKPSAAEFRRDKARREREFGKRVLSGEQIRSLVEAAVPALKAAILLGINGGFGNTDCAALPVTAVDLEAGIIDFERPKTAVRRIVPLWPETVTSLKVVLAMKRPKPATQAYGQLVFRSEPGLPLVRQVVTQSADGQIEKATHVDRLLEWFDQLLTEKKLKRRGIGFYTLRHTFRTWADETNDQHAIHLVMGHAIPGMSGIYVEGIGIERLRRVVNHVRAKVWPNAAALHLPATAGDQASTDEVDAGT